MFDILISATQINNNVNMDRIIIALTKLSRENWGIIYRFIKSIVHNKDIVYRQNAYREISSIAQIRIDVVFSEKAATDVYSLDGSVIENERLYLLSESTCFSIIYYKSDDSEDFTELVPFVILQQEFGGSITLGIDVGRLEMRKQQRYRFRCSDFFILIEKPIPKLGENSLYFINAKDVDKKTGVVKVFQVARFAGEGESGYSGNSSRRFLPLIPISENNYKTFFGDSNIESKEQGVIIESLNKIKKEWERKKLLNLIRHELNGIFNSSETPFEQWIEGGYFYSYDKDLKNIEAKKIKGIRNTLQIFKSSIKELIQNVIFHGGKKGLFYCVFDKKSNVSDSYEERIPDFKNYKNDDRFLRIGVFDFGEMGIVDTFSSERKVNLTDFFDINSIITADLSRLDLRYAAHLGIKTFVKTIVDGRGYFCVESCEHNNGIIKKKHLHSVVSKMNSYLSAEMTDDFAKGTHYEIILPVLERQINENSQVLVQTTSISDKFSALLDLSYPIYAIRFPLKEVESICFCGDKREQENKIKSICKKITDLLGKDNNTEVAFDFDNQYISPSSVFKILAFLQLSMDEPLEKIILVNVTNVFSQEFCSLINKLLVENNDGEIPIWSVDCALIILNDDLHPHVIWGKSKNQLYFINREYKKLYYNNFLGNNPTDNPFDKEYGVIGGCKKNVEKFVLPYDVLIRTKNQGECSVYLTLFERFLDQLLRKNIVSEESGFSVNHQYTYIGRKIIVKNYYEADSLFQNNFFVERFAYLITRDIINALASDKNKNNGKAIVIIGYKYYSEFLLKTIQKLMESAQNQTGFTSVLLGICNEGKDFADNNVTFSFDINGDGKETDRIITNPTEHIFITLVPIGATLSTNDKIISLFKLWLENNKKSKIPVEKIQFSYNHCSIVVRDKVGEYATALEIEQKWDNKIDLSDHLIVTNYLNANKVHYTIQIAERSQDGEGNWTKRLNNTISFPKNWIDEKYVNLTENSSINSQNLMDYPKVDLDFDTEEKELERLFLMKDFIYKGHIQRIKGHHKFYIDTESFVRKKNYLLKKWLETIHNDLLVNNMDFFKHGHDFLNVLVTPNVESESDFVRRVNDVIFEGSGLIVYLDVNNWRNNIVNKLSFLKRIDCVRYHYVDQAFLTGNTYHKTKSYLFSIIENNNVSFYSAFTVINRMPYAKNKEIRDELQNNIFAYLNLHFPMGNEWEQECEMCRLEKYYEDLEEKTVLQSCAEVICKNKSKISQTDLEKIKKKGDEEWRKRIFLRLVTTHWLYYRISRAANSGIDIEHENESKKDRVNNELDLIYSSLCDETDQGCCLLNQKIDQWFMYTINEDLFSKTEDADKKRALILDKKISFLKVISSPPLSQYIAIREYSQKKLLTELNITINKEGQHTVEDLKIVKAILKSLSFLKSNALVRKDVLVGVWKVLEESIVGMDEECKRYAIQDFSKDVQFFVKNSIVEDESKATFLGELLRQGVEMTSFNNIQISNTRMLLNRSLDKVGEGENNELFCAFKNCENKLLRDEYSRFLVWLFYDNTTIIRNTLSNFSKELEKDKRIYNSFYKEEKLKSIHDFKKGIDETKKLYVEKINEEYYYSSFRPYINNGDGIDFVEKIIYITYAKLKLKDIDNHKNHIESDTRDLMGIFAAIMGADAAFWTMKKDLYVYPSNSNRSAKNFRIYPISLFENDCDDTEDMGDKNKMDYEEWNSADASYTYQIYQHKKVYFPLIPKYNIEHYFGERRLLNAHSLGVYIITANWEENKTTDNIYNVISCITFLYNTPACNEKDFRIKFQESGRLLLLLKQEIDKYAVEYLFQKKVFELWEKVHLSSRRFEKIYANSSHIFNKVYREMEEFEKLDRDTIYKLSKTWFFLTNETISFLYSTIERDPHHFLKLEKYYIVDERNTLGETFNHTFICILSALLKSRWDRAIDNVANTIYINNQPLEEFTISDSLKNVPIHCNKHLIRTFIAQCLHNSLSPLGFHGHRYNNEIKKVNISISDSDIVIEDSCLIGVPEQAKSEQARLFLRKKKFIQNMKCEEYSSTTLTSLQGFVNYMHFSCDYSFNNDNNFKVTITFNPDKNHR